MTSSILTESSPLCIFPLPIGVTIKWRTMGKNKSVIVIGGGIVGLSTAYFLHKEGHKVTVLDKSDISAGASFVNAGYLTPSHIISLASPGMITQFIQSFLHEAQMGYRFYKMGMVL